jgi:hypothetical protein
MNIPQNMTQNKKTTLFTRLYSNNTLVASTLIALFVKFFEIVSTQKKFNKENNCEKKVKNVLKYIIFQHEIFKQN